MLSCFQFPSFLDTFCRVPVSKILKILIRPLDTHFHNESMLEVTFLKLQSIYVLSSYVGLKCSIAFICQLLCFTLLVNLFFYFLSCPHLRKQGYALLLQIFIGGISNAISSDMVTMLSFLLIPSHLCLSD